MPTLTNRALDQLQSRFFSIVPRIETHARIYFRFEACRDKRADKISETIAIAWKWFCRLMEKGKDATQFAGALASLAARAVKCGRRACGQEKAKDVLSWVAQRRHGFTVQSLPAPRRGHDPQSDEANGQRLLDLLEERLRDNTVTPPPEQAAFRIDFPRWLQTLTARERRMIRAMTGNERTKELSQRFRVSPGRISQMRREFKEGWQRFVGDLEEKGHGASKSVTGMRGRACRSQEWPRAADYQPRTPLVKHLQGASTWEPVPS
jgi:hypothetical protein